MKNVTMKHEAIMQRVNKMVSYREEFIKDIENQHVKLQGGNRKTGKDVYTVSLIPIADCKNCKECMHNCYDIRNDCLYEAVVKDRAKNSAIHKVNIERFWNEINTAVKYNHAKALRINVGGDLKYEDFPYVKIVAKENPDCSFLFFTKSYDDINEYLDKNVFPDNVHPIISRWIGTECNNKHNLPESHVLFEDGTTTAPEYGSYYCGGDCSECLKFNEGCFNLKNGESVIFKAH